MEARPAVAADVPGLVPLLKHLPCLVWNGKDAPLHAAISAFITQRGPGHLFVAGPAGKPMAAAVVYVLPLVGTTQTQVLLDDLIVGPEGRGQGLGKLLVAHVTAWAATQGAAHVSARVDPGEPAGSRTFASCGFEHADALMQKVLP